MASRDLIEGLLAQGYTYSSIGKAIDRDSSLVSQVAKGKKPGRNLEASLEALLKSGLVETLPPRRTTRSGTQARVRKSGPRLICCRACCPCCKRNSRHSG